MVLEQEKRMIWYLSLIGAPFTMMLSSVGRKNKHLYVARGNRGTHYFELVKRSANCLSYYLYPFFIAKYTTTLISLKPEFHLL